MVWFKRLILTFAVAILVGGAVFTITRHSSVFQVRSIPIEIVEDMDIEQAPFRADGATISGLQSRLRKRLQKLERQKLWEIDIDQVGAWVRADDWVRHVRISRAFPNRLEVSVTARAPVFLLATSKGKMIPIAADAALVETANANLLPDVPILRGDRFLSDESLRRRAIAFARQLPAEGPLGMSSISEITWTSEEGFVILLLPSKTEVKLGEEGIPLKLARVEQILEYLNTHQLKGRVIDASFSKKVLVRLRKGP